MRKGVLEMISTRGRYALRVMIDLAEHQTEGYIPLKEIAERQEISEKYLENILKTLVQNRLLAGVRGKGGGYRLTCPPEEYTVGSVLRLTEVGMAPVACLEPNAQPCPRVATCRTLPMWKEFNTVMNNYFDGVALADLLASDNGGNDYII